MVIGAGAVGLASAQALARAGLDVMIVESEAGIGRGISSRNSGVIHSGIYYDQGSNKATECVRGRHMLYEFCGKYGVSHRKCGKLIVATNIDEVSRLDDLYEKARANGVTGLERISQRNATKLEPELSCVEAILVPETGIVDAHEYMLSLEGIAREHGVGIGLNTKMVRAERIGQNFRVYLSDGADEFFVDTAWVINSGGLGATTIAKSVAGIDEAVIPETYFAKGNYFALSGKSCFTRLIYPMPVPGGLGVHLTLDLGGMARFGPDVEWIDEIDYGVNPARSKGFYAAIRRYWPALPDGALQPSYSGIRPKISPPGSPPDDFVIQTELHHGVRGLVNLFGIESPGLTSSLGIAQQVSDIITMG